MESGAAIHLALDGLEAVDLSFSLAVFQGVSTAATTALKSLFEAIGEIEPRGPIPDYVAVRIQCSMPSLSRVVMASRKSRARSRIDRMIGRFTATCSNKIHCCSDRRSVGLHVRMAACLGAMRSSLRFFD